MKSSDSDMQHRSSYLLRIALDTLTPNKVVFSADVRPILKPAVLGLYFLALCHLIKLAKILLLYYKGSHDYFYVKKINLQRIITSVWFCSRELFGIIQLVVLVLFYSHWSRQYWSQVKQAADFSEKALKTLSVLLVLCETADRQKLATSWWARWSIQQLFETNHFFRSLRRPRHSWKRLNIWDRTCCVYSLILAKTPVIKGLKFQILSDFSIDYWSW